MLASPVWRGRVGQRRVLAVFAASLVLGGLATASVLWLLSGLAAPLPDRWAAAVLMGLAGAALLRDLGVLSIRLPQNARLVPQTLFYERGAARAALRFGFELGTGVRTYLSASAPYVLAAAIVLVGNLEAAVVAGVAFGLGRALMPALRYASPEADAWDARLAARLRWFVPLSAGACLTAVAALAL
jgi:hypothetical protein